jgi:hypothetical protein
VKLALSALVALGIGAVISPTATSAAPIRPIEMSSSPVAEKVQHRRGFYRHGGNYYYNGHRGFRYARPGYRNYGGYWFPGAAFATGALIGGAIIGGAAAAGAYPDAGPYPDAGGAPYAGGDAHVQWCSQRFRSYDPSTDTYQPYNGPRQPCVSPY